jgi:hypothetical protein
MMTSPPFMSDTPWPRMRSPVALPHRDVRVARLEHGIEVAEQQQALALAAFAHGEQVAGAAHLGRQLDPARLEAERVELRAEQLADLAHAVRFMVPLLISTLFSSRASACGERALTAATMRCSVGSRPSAWAACSQAAARKASRNLLLRIMTFAEMKANFTPKSASLDSVADRSDSRPRAHLLHDPRAVEQQHQFRAAAGGGRCCRARLPCRCRTPRCGSGRRRPAARRAWSCRGRRAG